MFTTGQEVCNCRIADFIQFHNESCLADSIVLPMVQYLQLSGKTDKETMRDAVTFYSLTYSVPTTIVLLEKKKELLLEPKKFWKRYKNRLLFQSDRKYVKLNDRFIDGYFSVKLSGIYDYLDGEEVLDLEKCVNMVENCYSFGRFSAFLLLETYSNVFNRNFTNNKLDWLHGSTVTSGMLNVLGYDKEANLWDKNHNLPINPDEFDNISNKLLQKVSRGKNLTVLETNLCAYRKLFKGSRYIGYYSDRVLEELYSTIEQFPEHLKELEILFIAREMVIPEKYLGEKHGWTGIRKELKKYYLENGVWQW